MNERSVAAALAMIGHGFLLLGEALNKQGVKDTLEMLQSVSDPEADQPSLHKAVKEQEAVTRARAGKPEPEPEAKPIRRLTVAKPKPEPEAEPDEQEDHTSNEDAQAQLNALSDDDLDGMGRSDLKQLAEALGFETQGKKGDDLRAMLKQKRSGKRAAVAAPVKVVKAGKKAKSDEPDLDTMRSELNIFFKANKDVIEESYPDFFEDADDDEEYDAENPKAAIILASDELTESEWRDNVPDAKASGEWDTMVEAAEAEVD